MYRPLNGCVYPVASRITLDSKVQWEKPIIKGARIAVEFILELLANGWNVKDILKNYHQLKREDVVVALKYTKV